MGASWLQIFKKMDEHSTKERFIRDIAIEVAINHTWKEELELAKSKKESLHPSHTKDPSNGYVRSLNHLGH